MGPKKEIKKQVIEQPPKQKIPQIPAHQLQGYGKFTYPSGGEYVGEWKLFKGIKMKHGKGVLTVQNVGLSQIAKEMYDGQWCEDKMSGTGTYHYADGSIYRGGWKNNQHHNAGIYQFANGTVYEGEFEEHAMHGTGYFIDHTGRKWGGEFRRGKFQSRNQTELVREKAISLRKIEIKKQIEGSLQALLEAIAKSDKKTLKENLAPFFAAGDNLKQFIKDPYSKFDERAPDKWTEIINIAKLGIFKVLQSASEATVIAAERILGRQMEGNGQFVEILGSKDEKTVKMGLVGLDQKRWIIACVVEEEKKK